MVLGVARRDGLEMKHEGKHRWAMSWPGNYCVCCGQDDIIESAICCPNCEWAPFDGTEVEPSPKLCAQHQALANMKCPCTKEHEDGWRM